MDSARPYNPAGNMSLDTVIPIVEGYKETEAAGARISFSDGLNLSRLDLSTSYSPDDDLPSDERFHFDGVFHYWNWQVRATYNRADFYDLFGPLDNSRKGYSLGFEWGKTLFYDEPRTLRFVSDFTGWGDIDALPGFQNVAVDTDRLLLGGVGLEYEHLRKSLGAVDDEAGLTWSAHLNGSDAQGGDTVASVWGEVHRGWSLPLDHSSIWLRGSAGGGFGDFDDAFSRFYFGGFRNNYVDRLEEKRYRTALAMPGLEIDEISGRSFAKAMVEWTLPPVRFRSAGKPSFYLNWIRPALFASLLETDFDLSSASRTTWNVGAQLDLRMVMFSNLPATLSLGYARAYESGDSRGDEVLISLKIL